METKQPKQDEEISTITLQHIMSWKTKIFEMCNPKDTVTDPMIVSYNKLSTVIQKVIPNSTDKVIHEMFDRLDTNTTGTIHLLHFLIYKNFDAFLNSCGYSITTDIQQWSPQHARTVIYAQEEIMEKLSKWISNIGQPAQVKAASFERQNESLQHKLQTERMQMEALKHELSVVTEEHQSMQSVYQSGNNEKDVLTKEVQHSRDNLMHLQAKNDEIESENKYLKKENNKLKLQIQVVKDKHNEFAKTNALLKDENEQNVYHNESLGKQREHYEYVIGDLHEQMKSQSDVIAQQTQEINELREKMNSTGNDGMKRQRTIMIDPKSMKLAGLYGTDRSDGVDDTDHGFYNEVDKDTETKYLLSKRTDASQEKVEQSKRNHYSQLMCFTDFWKCMCVNEDDD